MYVFSNGQFSVSVLYINENQCQYIFKPVLIKNFIQVTLGIHLSALMHLAWSWSLLNTSAYRGHLWHWSPVMKHWLAALQTPIHSAWKANPESLLFLQCVDVLRLKDNMAIGMNLERDEERSVNLQVTKCYQRILQLRSRHIWLGFVEGETTTSSRYTNNIYL